MSTLPVIRRQIPRNQLQPGEVLCSYCTAKCCQYFALPVEAPTTHADFDNFRWYLLHGQASLFTDDEVWYLCVLTPCKHLQADYRCGIYETRPQICRDHTIDGCEYEDSYCYERYFETAEQIHEYAEAILGPPPGRGIRTPEPSPLAVLS